MQNFFKLHSQVLIQGITGKEGQRALQWMRAMGTDVVAGVTPGKGGQVVDGVPVFNSVKEALHQFPDTTTASLYVPPRFVKSAALETLDAGIPFIHIFAEGVPTLDTVEILEQAEKKQVKVLGPSSIGLARPGEWVIGSLGGGRWQGFLPATKAKGGVAIISKSGGMANTVAHMLTQVGIPQSSVVGIGGDRIVGSTFADFLGDFDRDSLTNIVLVIGEIGGSYEEDLAAAIKEKKFSKPVVAYVAGLFAETLPRGVAFGHAGAIVSKSSGTRMGKIEALRKAGAIVAEDPSQIVEVVKQAMNL